MHSSNGQGNFKGTLKWNIFKVDNKDKDVIDIVLASFIVDFGYVPHLFASKSIANFEQINICGDLSNSANLMLIFVIL